MNKNIVDGAKCLELINNLDSLMLDMLFRENDGFTKLEARDVVLNSSRIIEQFNYEAQKLISQSGISDTEQILKKKKDEFYEYVKNYSEIKSYDWCEEIFNNFLDNTLFFAHIYKSSPNKIKEILHQVHCAINWITDINKSDKNKLLNEFNKKINNILSTEDSSYLPKLTPQESDYGIFLKVRDDIFNGKTDFDEYKQKLNSEDINYFNKIINDLKTFKRTQILEDIMLVNTALSAIKTNNNKQKYDFIKEVDGDITAYLIKNKKIDESEKIEIVKRRIKLFEDISQQNKVSSYFKKLLAS